MEWAIAQEAASKTKQLFYPKEGTDGKNQQAAEGKKEKKEKKDKADWKRKQAIGICMQTP